MPPMGFDAVVKDDRHGIFQHAKGHGAEKQHDTDTDDADKLAILKKSHHLIGHFFRVAGDDQLELRYNDFD